MSSLYVALLSDYSLKIMIVLLPPAPVLVVKFNFISDPIWKIFLAYLSQSSRLIPSEIRTMFPTIVFIFSS